MCLGSVSGLALYIVVCYKAGLGLNVSRSRSRGQIDYSTFIEGLVKYGRWMLNGLLG